MPPPNALSDTRIDHLAREAMAPLDEDLLRRYFAHQAALGPLLDTTVTPEEARTVVQHLNLNPRWAAAWQALEHEFGLQVAWPRLHVLRADRPHRRLLRPARVAALASLAAVLLYGLLWAAGSYTLPETHAWASVSSYADRLERNTRSTPATPSTDYAQGVAALLGAYKTTWGLFPRYEGAHVEAAIGHLEAAYARSVDDFARAEAAFMLAKAHLMKDDRAGAHQWLLRTQALPVDDYFSAETEALVQRLRP